MYKWPNIRRRHKATSVAAVPAGRSSRSLLNDTACMLKTGSGHRIRGRKGNHRFLGLWLVNVSDVPLIVLTCE